jgi:8-oxo-dGTP pyrophosphatase MutT (NUDIX family)
VRTADVSDPASVAEVTPGNEGRGPLLDPESIPHDPDFDKPSVRGAAVPTERLGSASLRERLARPPAWTPEIRTDGRWRSSAAAVRPAAVLLPLVARGDALHVLLTERTAHLHDHAGQISFPGGRVDAGDRDAIHTALREAEEEIGLPSATVEVLGTLPEYVTATGYAVTPVVGLIERPFSLALDSFEVAEAFEVPLGFLMDPANHERRRIVFAGAMRTFYAMPWTSAQRRYFIWGATAAMLRNFYQLLRA